MPEPVTYPTPDLAREDGGAPGARSIADELTAAVTTAITSQIESDATADSERRTAERLVREALAQGHGSQGSVRDVHEFSAGNTALMVARIDTSVTFVVKVDSSPSLVAEAHLLKRISDDPALPETLRRAFPSVYAVDDEGPIYGYLMESLEGYRPLSSYLSAGRTQDAGQLVGELWQQVLAPAYLATRRRRAIPNVVEDYFVRATERLETAATAGLLPAGDVELVIGAGDAANDVVLPDGWRGAMARASSLLETVAPPFGTFVHGDPNPENVLVRESDTGEHDFRLIDPKDWWTGDYLFDAGKLGHYIRVTSIVERDGLPVEFTDPEPVRLRYDARALLEHAEIEEALLVAVRTVAEDREMPDDVAWRTRYELAVAANLLGIVGPRLSRAATEDAPRHRELALVGLGEGLRIIERLVAQRS